MSVLDLTLRQPPSTRGQPAPAGSLRRRLEANAAFSPRECALIDDLVSQNIGEVAARRDLIREGEKPRHVHVVLEGWACRYKQLPCGRRQIVAFLIPGDLCNANAFILNAMDHSIGAITRLRHAEIAARRFGDLMDSSPGVTRALWWNELVGAAIQREWTVNVGKRNAYERIAHLFCEMFARLDAVGLVQGHGCDWPLTQTDLADATSLTPVHVNRTLQELRLDGLIELRGRRLSVPDMAALQSVAMFSADYLHLARPCTRLDAAV